MVLHDINVVCRLSQMIGKEGPVREALAEAIDKGSLEPIESLSKSDDAGIKNAVMAILELKPQQ